MSADGENINVLIVKFVDHPVFLAKPARPETCQIMSQHFRFADAHRWIIAQHFFQNVAERFVQAWVTRFQCFVNFPRIAFKHQGSFGFLHPKERIPILWRGFVLRTRFVALGLYSEVQKAFLDHAPNLLR